MFGFMRKEIQAKATREPPSEVVRETDHDETNVRDAILASNVS